MLTVIFGAGASFDSNHSLPADVQGFRDRLPRANQLFEARPEFQAQLAKYPRIRPILERLRFLEAEDSIESRLEGLREEADSGGQAAERRRQLVAIRFYIQSVISHCSGFGHSRANGATNYISLLDQICHHHNNRVTLVTFNYDDLLDQAVEGLEDTQIETINDYLPLGRFGLFKVHGSINWGRVVSNPPTAIHACAVPDVPQRDGAG